MMNIDEAKDVAKMGWPENQKAQRQHDAVDWLIAEVDALTAENTRIFTMVDAREQTIAELTALCDGYRGERDAAQWSTDVLAEVVKTLKAELNCAAEVIINAAEASARQEKLGQDLILENAKLRHALTRARAEGMADKADVERWRAVIGCARIRVLGSAGIMDRKPDGYAHLGLELWTRHEAGTEPVAIEWLTAFADIAVACRLAEQANKEDVDA